MSKYYVVFERPDGDTLKRDGYIFEFEHDVPTEEELIKAMGDILGGTDKGTIIFMQKLYTDDGVDLTNLRMIEQMMPIPMEGEENAEQ